MRVLTRVFRGERRERGGREEGTRKEGVRVAVLPFVGPKAFSAKARPGLSLRMGHQPPLRFKPESDTHGRSHIIHTCNVYMRRRL